jgi:hypothetical protein
VAESGAFVEHMTEIRDQSDEATIEPVDLLILVIGLANAWHLSSPTSYPPPGKNQPTRRGSRSTAVPSLRQRGA